MLSIACNLEPVPEKGEKAFRMNNHWALMYCADGTKFDMKTCGCIVSIFNKVRKYLTIIQCYPYPKQTIYHARVCFISYVLVLIFSEHISKEGKKGIHAFSEAVFFNLYGIVLNVCLENELMFTCA